MKIMIFIEPLIEIGTPLSKSYWSQNLVPILASSIKHGFKGRAEITLISGSTFTSPQIDNIDRVILVDPLGLVDLWTESPDESLVQALRWPHGPASRKLANSLRRGLNVGNFDAIIAFGAPAYLPLAFPETLILFHEFSYFKAPGPQTWYFDPIGPGGSAWFNLRWSLVRRNWHPSEKQLSLARTYRDTYRAKVKSMSEKSLALHDFSNNFKNIVLLPLQLDQVSSFESISPVRSQFNLALAIINKLPDDIGLVITEHPRGIGGLNDDGRNYLRNKNNVIFAEKSGNLDPSDSVAPYVNAIATVSSTVGMLSLLWSKSLISISGNYMSEFSDQCGPPPWNISFRDEAEDLHIISFLMSHWSIPFLQLTDPEWMKEMIIYCMRQSGRSADPTLPPVPAWNNSDETIYEAWISPLVS